VTHLLATAGPGRVLSPLVRRYARARGIDPATVHGTGVGGRVRRPDIDAALRTTGSAPAPAPVARNGERSDTAPLTGMRAVIAARMHASLREMAQLTLGSEVTFDAVVALREQLLREADDRAAVPGLNDFVVRAAAVALREHPGLNATLRPEGIVRHPAVDVGIAVAVPGGLVVPVVRAAADGPLPDLAARIRALACAAREGRLRLADLEGATFAVTTLGAYGVELFTPVVMPGNVAILGVGRLRDGIAWSGEIPRRSRLLMLSLTFDHRAVDGAPAAEYLNTVSGLLQSPIRLLAG
jgi:pyruvate/2-oxoglutarate dehydrogenase complex dihydrolipoamide acyltransferase (E2) component